jgi:hypothetical protein
MTQITKSQIAAMHVLLHKHKLQDDKRDIIRQISKGRTESTLELTFTEAQTWINAMNKGESFNSKKEEDPRQRMINSIIAMAREMGTVRRKKVVDAAGKIQEKSDYSDFNKWMVEHSYMKKDLNKYTYEELPKLVSQFKQVYRSWLNRFH